jgi:ankyrin repeat protein
LFLKNLGNPNVFSRSRRTPLMDAIASQFDINVQLLLKYGADPNHGESCSSTVANARFDYTVALLEHGLSKDLSFCGRLVQRAVIREDSPRQVWRKKVFELLAERGVKPPFDSK